MNQTLFLIASILFSMPLQAAVKEFKVAADAKAIFEAVGKPSLLKIKSSGAPVTGSLSVDEKAITGKFDVDVAAFETGISLRDRHMKEKYLETEKHPKATLELQSVDVPSAWKPGADLKDAKFKGQLTIKGVAKPIEGVVSVNGADMKANAKFSVSLKEFPVGVPSYMGVTVADSVNVDIEIPSFTAK